MSKKSKKLLDDLKYESDRLHGLMVEPQEGLMSWNICLGNVLKNIASIAKAAGIAEYENHVKPSVHIIYGNYAQIAAEELLSVYNNSDGDMNKVQEARDKMADADFSIDTVEFNTEAERTAYCQGRDDMAGWMDYMDVDAESFPILQKILDETEYNYVRILRGEMKEEGSTMED